MSKFLSSNNIIKVLLAKGFVFISQKGSHAKFRNSFGSPVRTVIVPTNRREIPLGTFKSIVRQAGLAEEEFISL